MCGVNPATGSVSTFARCFLDADRLELGEWQIHQACVQPRRIVHVVDAGNHTQAWLTSGAPDLSMLVSELRTEYGRVRKLGGDLPPLTPERVASMSQLDLEAAIIVSPLTWCFPRIRNSPFTMWTRYRPPCAALTTPEDRAARAGPPFPPSHTNRPLTHSSRRILRDPGHPGATSLRTQVLTTCARVDPICASSPATRMYQQSCVPCSSRPCGMSAHAAGHLIGRSCGCCPMLVSSEGRHAKAL